MFQSLKNLYKNEYNKKHSIFAFRRFIFWKIIRLFGLNNVKYTLWGNRKILLDSKSFHSMWLMYNYIVDWEEFNLIKDYIKADHTVLDVGTNMGYYTVWISKFIGQNGQIHCFEPDSSNFKKLKQNAEINNLVKTAKLNNIALSDTNGFIPFTLGLDGQNHINLDQSNKSVNVDTKKLDTYAEENNIEQISYAKIDVEGFEYSVLKGAVNLLNNKKIDIIQLEINNTVENSTNNVDDILHLLANHNYILSGYNTGEKKLFPITYTPSRENYFAVHNLNSINQQLSPVSETD
ncbi:FkbM family methyltransferase [Pedobacter fastidiosus]|uniref:FkbM family methyltransferase n=1 Tax=Pedobacter fastidiosus TaxID=2765361 RepID=A0ABR7KVR2_9SPHI|nr:FkbM family methyltransferase [Pedobacter fastidiosus]MBC6112157.1 FkbM family methyltransferase [Pedobacter fastidiosus]